MGPLIYQFEDGKIIIVKRNNQIMINIVHDNDDICNKLIEKIKNEGLTFLHELNINKLSVDDMD